MSSAVWKFYERIPLSKNVVCNICKKELNRKDGSTKGLWSHLELKHPEQHKTIKLKDSTDATTTTSTISSFITQKDTQQLQADEHMARTLLKNFCFSKIIVLLPKNHCHFVNKY